MDEDEFADLVAETLYNHWQRDVGETAKVAWKDVSPTMERVFFDKAEAVLDAVNRAYAAEL